MKKRYEQDNKLYTLIISIAVALIAVVKAKSCNDQGLTIRHIIWCVVIAMMVWSLFDRGTIDIHVVVYLLAGWFVFVLVSGLHAVNKAEWIYESFRALLAVVTVVVLLNMLDKNIFYKLMTLLLVGLCIYNLIAGWGHYSVFKGLGGNKNPWSATLMLLMPFAMTTCWPVTLLPLANIALLGTRSVILAAGAICMFHKKLRYIVLAGGIIFVVMYWQKFSNTESLLERRDQYKATVCMAKDNPFGVGAGNWKIIAPSYSEYFSHPYAFGKIIITRCHNDYLQMAAEVGVVGLILWLAVLGYSLKCARHDKTAAAGIIGYMIFAFFSFPAERPFHSFMILVFIALACKGKNFKVYRFRKSHFRIIAVLLVLCGADFCFRHMANRQSVEIRMANNVAALDVAVTHISPLANLDPGNAMPLHLYRAISREGFGKRNEAIKAIEKAVENHPYSPMTLIVQAGLLINSGRRAEARQVVAQAEAIRPGISIELIKRRVKPNTGGGVKHVTKNPPPSSPAPLNL